MTSGKKIVAVMACYGRLPLLRYTIERLLKKNGCDAVVCVGGQDEKQTVINAGGIFVEHENYPLGKKWNAGFKAAKELNPDGLLFVGSSDWLTDNWLPVLVPYLDKFDMIGKPDFYLFDIGTIDRSCHWVGYGQGERELEPIGIGRLVSARIMEKFDWSPFDSHRNSSMDWQMYLRVRNNSGKIKLITSDGIRSLSISTNRWSNLHKFEDHWMDKVPSKSTRLFPDWAHEIFPELKLIFND